MSPSALPRLRAIKRRTAARRGQDGAALFIVAMSLAVLASVGIFALAAASAEAKSAGYERTAAQSNYLASYGVLGGAHEIGATRAAFYLGLMMTTPDPVCLALPNVPPTANILTRACRRLGGPGAPQPELAWAGLNTLDSYTGTVPYQQGVKPGSMGPLPMQGDFFVELTDPTKYTAPKRYDLNLNMCFVELTATSNGLTHPLFPSNPNFTATFGEEGIVVQRARWIAGPLPCPR
jgi:hypothetical protein